MSDEERALFKQAFEAIINGFGWEIHSWKIGYQSNKDYASGFIAGLEWGKTIMEKSKSSLFRD